MRTPLYKSRPYGPHSARFEAQRINEFILMSEGCSNSYLIETGEGAILINTGMGYEAPVHQRNYESLSSQANAVKYAITTQGHVDHVGGVQYFRDRNPDLEYLAQAQNMEHQNYDARLGQFRGSRSAFRFMDAFREDFAHYAKHDYTDINTQDRPVPDSVFEQQFNFSLGDLQVELIAIPGAETNDSLVVWLPQHRICFTGNLFGCPFGHFPNLSTVRGDRYRDALTCANAAQRILDLEPELILYGHHAPIAGSELIRNELTAIRDAILYVHDETVKGMNEGKSLHVLMQEIKVPAECEVGDGYGKVSWGVRAIWEHYAGWFKHHSTAELYSVPQSSISADLVELAGVDALMQRAQEHFDKGQHEQALHLLDVVLGAQPENATALALSVSVHRALLKSADNFWLVGWLENQIKLLQGGSTGPLSFK
jgi:alkyl sulfatase BDS1-like metallo-beta-lactamase superfamily hydrolase